MARHCWQFHFTDENTEVHLGEWGQSHRDGHWKRQDLNPGHSLIMKYHCRRCNIKGRSLQWMNGEAIVCMTSWRLHVHLQGGSYHKASGDLCEARMGVQMCQTSWVFKRSNQSAFLCATSLFSNVGSTSLKTLGRPNPCTGGPPVCNLCTKLYRAPSNSYCDSHASLWEGLGLRTCTISSISALLM